MIRQKTMMTYFSTQMFKLLNLSITCALLFQLVSANIFKMGNFSWAYRFGNTPASADYTRITVFHYDASGDYVYLCYNFISSNRPIWARAVKQNVITGEIEWTVPIGPSVSTTCYDGYYHELSDSIYFVGIASKPFYDHNVTFTVDTGGVPEPEFLFACHLSNNGTIIQSWVVKDLFGLTEPTMAVDKNQNVYIGGEASSKALLVKLRPDRTEEWRKIGYVWDSGRRDLIVKMAWEDEYDVLYVVGYNSVTRGSGLTFNGAIGVAVMTADAEIVNTVFMGDSSFAISITDLWFSKERVFIGGNTAEALDGALPFGDGVSQDLFVTSFLKLKNNLDDRKTFLYGSRVQDVMIGCGYDKFRDFTFCTFLQNNQLIRTIRIENDGYQQHVYGSQYRGDYVVGYYSLNFKYGTFIFAAFVNSAVPFEGVTTSNLPIGDYSIQVQVEILSRFGFINTQRSSPSTTLEIDASTQAISTTRAGFQDIRGRQTIQADGQQNGFDSTAIIVPVVAIVGGFVVILVSFMVFNKYRESKIPKASQNPQDFGGRNPNYAGSVHSSQTGRSSNHQNFQPQQQPRRPNYAGSVHSSAAQSYNSFNPAQPGKDRYGIQ